MTRSLLIAVLAGGGLGACATVPEQGGTLAELDAVHADLEEVYLEDSLDRAAESYRAYLAETSESALTPEAMRRLADLQLEREYGVMQGPQIIEMAAPTAAAASTTPGEATLSVASQLARDTEQESEQEFERRASERQEMLAANDSYNSQLPIGEAEAVPDGPREAIETYKKILANYPNYERNDQVLYQMSRAYDELGQPDEAMVVMERLVGEYGYSDYLDEVHFRRGDYYFVRKRFIDAEEAYGAVIDMGEQSSYYELALYKLGWTLYKQELYEEALHRYMAVLDYRKSIGYDFDQADAENEEHRVADTFRVISLSFSNLGDADIVNEYFAKNGQRSYADRIYSNLGEFHFAKLRYDDAASIYKSFIGLNPRHRKSPYFSMRVVEIYDEAGFPQLVVEAKKEFATSYALSSTYWTTTNVAESDEVVGFLKTNLTDLANHYHALYQDEALAEEQSESFREASNWYQQFLTSFPDDPGTPAINYQLADLLLENENYSDAAAEYERTAYEYAPHEQASGAGYAAVYAYREDLKLAEEGRYASVRQETVQSSLRFADTFPDHDQAPLVLGAAADDLYEMQDFPLAIASAHKLIERYPDTEQALLRAAWTVVAHSSIDTEAYPDAERAYLNVLTLTAEDDESRTAIIDGLAASIYKQAEQSVAIEDYRAAANHFLRIKAVAPSSAIRTAAEYDAAAALIRLQDWTMASGVLEDFRSENPEHELNADATKQLAFIYREDGQIERSANEYERISAEAIEPELSREALLTAAELYDEAASMDNAVRVYEQYVVDFPAPLDVALETRTRLADIFKGRSNLPRYYAELGEIIAIDGNAGTARTDRSRYLAAGAALVLAELNFTHFAELSLDQPFEESLAEKQQRMDQALLSFEQLVPYEVAEVTAAATYYIAETYFEFSRSLLESERPEGLSASEQNDYEMVIEEEAFPFEERGIEVHVENMELLTAGIYNPWVQKSLDKLAVLMPGRYAKNEISSGYVGSIDVYAYRMPIAPDPDAIDEEATAQVLDTAPDGAR